VANLCLAPCIAGLSCEAPSEGVRGGEVTLVSHRWHFWLDVLSRRLSNGTGRGLESAKHFEVCEDSETALVVRVLGMSLFSQDARSVPLRLATLKCLVAMFGSLSASSERSTLLAPAGSERRACSLERGVASALEHILGRRAKGGRRVRHVGFHQVKDDLNRSCWVSAGPGVLALTPRYAADVFVTDFALLRPCHPLPVGAAMTIFYPRVRGRPRDSETIRDAPDKLKEFTTVSSQVVTMPGLPSVAAFGF